MTDDEFDPLPADMMRARRRMTPGIYVHRRGIAKLEAVSGREVWHVDGDPTNNNIDNLELRPMTGAESLAHLQRDLDNIDRNKAAEARIGGWMVVHWAHARVWTAETLALAAKVGDMRSAFPTMLPEAAFDWPIYQAALYQSTEDCQSNGHRDPLYAE
jgi:hypothetical protein